MSRGWQGQRAQAKHTGEANRLLVKATPAMRDFRWNAGVLGPPPPPRPSGAQPLPAAPHAGSSSSSSSSNLAPTAAASAPAADGARADSLEEAQLQCVFAASGLAAAAAEAPAVAKAPGPPLLPNAPPEPPSVAKAPPVAKAPEPPADPVLAAVPEGAPVNPVPAGVPKATQNWRAVVGDGRVLRQPRQDGPHTVEVMASAVTTDTTRRSYTWRWWGEGWRTGWSGNDGN